MEKKYLVSTEDCNIQAILQREENIPVLEEILDKELKKLAILQNQKLDFGKMPKRKELPALFAEVKKDVDNFLHVENIPNPVVACNRISVGSYLKFIPSAACVVAGLAGISNIIGRAILGQELQDEFIRSLDNKSLYYAMHHIINGLVAIGGLALADGVRLSIKKKLDVVDYHPYYKHIRVKRTNFAILTTDLAHEYAHHVQNIVGINMNNHDYFTEGHAEGVARNIARIYAEKKDNPAYLLDTTRISVDEIKSVYLWLCEKFGKEADKNLVSDVKPCIMPDIHAIGNSMISIYEAQYGPRIYNEMMHGKFEFTEQIKPYFI
jgi:hypothetical protein